ncbi:MAG: hypothetical protein N2444_00005, partial [Methylocystis sp.]|nr:hypothetical protein [Methylocystis sp.]
MKLLFANNAASTLAGPITNTSTTINLAAGGGALFPNPSASEYFKMTITDAATEMLREIVHVTERSGDQLTVVRGQEGTTARNWAAGDFVDNLVTAGTMQAFVQGSGDSSVGFFQGDDESPTANAVVVPTTVPVNTSPQAGQLFLIKKGANGNTGPVTCAIGGSPARNVVFKDGSSLSEADWPAGAAALLWYTGSVYQFLACQANIPLTSRVHVGTDTGSVNAMVATCNPPVSSYVTGMLFVVIPANTNNGASTANLGAGARPIVAYDDSSLIGGEIVAGYPVLLLASSSKFVLIGAPRRATVANVRAGTSDSVFVTPASLVGAVSPITLTFAATIAWNMASGPYARVTLANSAGTIGVPTNPALGATYALDVLQDATGNRTVAWASCWDFGAAGPPSGSTAPNRRDCYT